MGCSHCSHPADLFEQKIPDLGFHCTLHETIGKGQFSTVKRGTDEHKRTVAVKCIPKSQVRNEMKLLAREIDILHRVKHEHVVHYYGCYKDEQDIYIMLEYCGGGNLKERVSRSGLLDEPALKVLARQLLQALVALHTLSIVHRDLKPENILFSEEGVAKLADFGLSRSLNNGDKLTIVGTPYYLAPEVIRGSYTAKCDIWSLGIVLYYAALGTLPFAGQNYGDLFSRILNANITKWGQLSEPTVAFLGSMLVRQPARRPSAADLLCHSWLQSS
jgi:calcium-dependent protein kinase